MEDPFAGILAEVDRRFSGLYRSPLCTGTVLEADGERLVIQADGLELDQDDLLVNSMLGWDYTEEPEVAYTEKGGKVELGVYSTVNVSIIDCGAGNHSSMKLFGLPGYLEGKVKATLTTRRLRTGDQVLLLRPMEDDLYRVLCKFGRWCDHDAVSAS